jgi:hypothetical protein
MIIFNHSICGIGVFPKYAPTPSRWGGNYRIKRNYKFKVGRKYLFFPVYEIIPEAVIRDGYHCELFICTLSEFPKETEKYYFEDDVLYEKPHCEIHLNDGSKHTVRFETAEELSSYVNDLKSQAVHIEIIKKN